MAEKKWNLGIRADERRWEALKNLATKKRTSVQGLVDDAINQAYFSEGTESASSAEDIKTDDLLLPGISRTIEGLVRQIADAQAGLGATLHILQEARNALKAKADTDQQPSEDDDPPAEDPDEVTGARTVIDRTDRYLRGSEGGPSGGTRQGGKKAS